MFNSVIENILLDLCSDEGYRVRELIASNNKVSSEILDKLSYDANEQIVALVAQNPNTSARTLERLVEEKYEKINIMSYIALHPNVSCDVVLKLLKHYNAVVRANLSTNKVVDLETLQVLSKDSSAYVKECFLRRILCCYE